MSKRERIFKGGALYGVGQILAQALSLCRNIIVANILSPTDMGVAALFATTMSFLEMLSDLQAGTMLIQAKEGDDSKLQATVHMIGAGRGIVISMVLVAIAGPAAWLFNVPQATWAFRVLALVPLVRGFAHSDPYRLQRDLSYSAAVGVELGSQLIALFVAWPLAAMLRSYSAVLWITLIQAGSWALISHVVARRPFEAKWERSCASHVIRFGGPLLINGLLMFAVFQGDRIVIGAADRLFGGARYSLADLGVYFVLSTFVMTPAAIPSKTFGAVFLPVLAKAQDDSEKFNRTYAVVMWLYCVLAASLAIPMSAAGGWVASIIYGQPYGTMPGLVMWLAATQGLRIVRAAVTLAAISRGDTTLSVWGTSVRVFGLVGVLVAAASSQPLAWIAAAGCVGELLALTYSIILLSRRHQVQGLLSVAPVSLCVVMITLTAAACWALHPSGLIAIGIGAIGITITLGLALAQSTQLRAEFCRAISAVCEWPTRKAVVIDA